jgi:hypothetical protein
MQKLFLSFVLLAGGFLVTPSPVFSQSPSLDKFYRSFKSSGETEGNISIDPSIMLSASFSGDENSGWMHKISQLRLLIMDGKKMPKVGKEWSELSQSLQEDRFEELFTIRKGKDKLQLLSKEGR